MTLRGTRASLPTLAHPPFVSPFYLESFPTFPGASPSLMLYFLPDTARKYAVSHPGRTPPKSTLRIGFNRKCERREEKGLLSTRRDHVSTYSTTSTWIYILFPLSPPSPSLVSVAPAPPHLALLPMHRRRTDSTFNPSTPSPGERATAACAYPAASRRCACTRASSALVLPRGDRYTPVAFLGAREPAQISYIPLHPRRSYPRPRCVPRSPPPHPPLLSCPSPPRPCLYTRAIKSPRGGTCACAQTAP
ncbi:hypothetical protein B0H16DRAFT_356412 [Mycena metata]|uniref:Uncharacterized protein n=1 Tax=Mycena metata TaxID=1033252 RepID=A0AAD7NMZ6_9AGAR|nr:hypothetical protein B0H16DRAFT_356412 [Mycena metata]